MDSKSSKKGIKKGGKMKTSDKAQSERPDITERLKDDKFVVGALQALYREQEADEQMMKHTHYKNGRGFNSHDAGVLSDIADFYNKRGLLTSKQIDFARRKIEKYSGQLEHLDIESLPIKKAAVDKKEIETLKWTGLLDNKILIKFQFPRGDSRFRETLGHVKTLTGRKWNPELDDKPWTCPLALDSFEALREWKFDISSELQEWYDKMQYEDEKKIVNIPGLGMNLYPFQTRGVEFVESRKGRALIGDEMGLGKTAQALAWIQLNKETSLPALVIVPASIKLNWERECKMWCPDLSVQILSGKSNGGAGLTDITIINYDIVSARKKELLSIKYKTVVMDEVHFTKNNKAQRTKAVRSLARRTKNIIALSGTPIVNRPIEFFNCLNMIMPERFPSFWKYAHEYCGAKHNGFGWDFSGASNIEKLHEIVTKSIMIRRKKSEVMKDLPAKVRIVIPLEIDNKKEYDKAEVDFISWVRKEFGNEKAASAAQASTLAEIEGLKQLTIAGKMNGIISWIQNFIESGEKLVVFCTHHKTVDILMDEFKGISVRLDGRNNQKAKQEAVDQFQTNNKIKLFVGNIKAAGIGITLTAASSTCFVELGWQPGEHDQAEDRVHRIGQEADSVNAYYLIAHDTIEEEIAELIDKKRKVLEKVLDGKAVEGSSLLSELLNRMLNK